MNPEITSKNITVTVTDGAEALENVDIILTDSEEQEYTSKTDNTGACTISNVPLGVYSIVASKTGYTDYEDTLNVTNETTSVAITLVESVVIPVTRDIHIDVTDGTNPVTGASVVIGETSRTTGDAGGCNFSGLTDGEYEVTITKEGFTTKQESITVNSENTSFTITLVSE